MIQLLLIILCSVVAVLVAASVVTWAIQREPAGHGQHAARRSQHDDEDDDYALAPLPVQDVTYDDRLQPHIAAAWAAAGTSQGAWWAAHAPLERYEPDALDGLIKSPLIQLMEAGYGPGDEAFDRAFWGDHYGQPGEPGDPDYFPAGAGPVPAVRERAAVTPPGSRRDGGPSNLPGPAQNAAANLQSNAVAGELYPHLTRTWEDSTGSFAAIRDEPAIPAASWLEQMTGGDPFDGLGQDGYLDRLFGRTAVAA